MRLNPKLVAGLFFCLLLAAGVALVNGNRQPARLGPSAPAEPLIAGAFDPPRAAPDFTLTGSNGSSLTLSSYRGKVVLLTFGFTHCAAVCPTTLATLAQARRSLGKATNTVQVVYVTVDPARDRAALMKDYLAAFDPTFVGATGDGPALASVMQKYGVTATKQGNWPDYAMSHTSSIFLIDPGGKLRGLMPFGHDAADVVHDIHYLSAHST